MRWERPVYHGFALHVVTLGAAQPFAVLGCKVKRQVWPMYRVDPLCKLPPTSVAVSSDKLTVECRAYHRSASDQAGD